MTANLTTDHTVNITPTKGDSIMTRTAQPFPWHDGAYKKVDFDDDSSTTLATVWVVDNGGTTPPELHVENTLAGTTIYAQEDVCTSGLVGVALARYDEMLARHNDQAERLSEAVNGSGTVDLSTLMSEHERVAEAVDLLHDLVHAIRYDS